MIELGRTSTGGIIAILTEAEFSKSETTPPTTSTILPYEHVSQRGVGAGANLQDCGAACVASIIRQHGYPDETVDEIAARYQIPNTAMEIWRVRQALGGYQIANTDQRPLRAEDISEHIRDGRWVIALVAYEKLPYRAFTYKTPHYIVCYGVDAQGILYHDPLSDGRELHITAGQMDHALVSGHGNQPFQGIVAI